MKASFIIGLLGACTLVCGCNRKSGLPLDQPTQTEGLRTSLFTASALTNSPSFIELKGRSERATFVVDEDAPDSVLVGIGEEMETHFTRFKTLKIDKRTGAITRLETDQNLEDKWLVEFQPQK